MSLVISTAQTETVASHEANIQGSWFMQIFALAWAALERARVPGQGKLEPMAFKSSFAGTPSVPILLRPMAA